MSITPDPEWKHIVDALQHHKGVAMVLGATDAGKTTLVRYLLAELVGKRNRVCLVDTDIGQSALGLPGTISMKVFASKGELKNFRFDRLYFVGSTNPATRIRAMSVGTKKMVGLCKKDAKVTLIDTTGLVSGGIGKLLKLKKIQAVEPQHIIAIQKGNELEHILRAIDAVPIYRLAPSSAAAVRRQEKRSASRKRKLEQYLDHKVMNAYLLRTNEVTIESKGKAVKADAITPGSIIGLNRNDNTLALGMVIETHGDAFCFISPVKSVKAVNKVILSDITLT